MKRFLLGLFRGDIANWIRNRALKIPAADEPQVCAAVGRIVGATITPEQLRNVEDIFSAFAVTQLDRIL